MKCRHIVLLILIHKTRRKKKYEFRFGSYHICLSIFLIFCWMFVYLWTEKKEEKNGHLFSRSSKYWKKKTKLRGKKQQTITKLKTEIPLIYLFLFCQARKKRNEQIFVSLFKNEKSKKIKWNKRISAARSQS